MRNIIQNNFINVLITVKSVKQDSLTSDFEEIFSFYSQGCLVFRYKTIFFPNFSSYIRGCLVFQTIR